MKHIVTPDDLVRNPELVEQGIKVGDEIDIPDDATNLSEDEGDDPPPPDDGSGGTHPVKPPGKP